MTSPRRCDASVAHAMSMRPIQYRHTAAIAFVGAFLLCSELCAQMPGPSPRAADVAASLRKKGSIKGGVMMVLTQARGPQTQQTMDEIADSLVVIAASFPGNDLRSSQTRLAAQGALLQAGMGVSGIVGSDRAIPYSGASVRLMRLVQTADDIGIRGASLRALTQLPDKRGVSEFLRQVATSRNPIAYLAIDLLYKEGEPGRVILRELYRSGRVTEEMAQENLRSYAYFLGW